jgi:hypothetical protein
MLFFLYDLPNLLACLDAGPPYAGRQSVWRVSDSAWPTHDARVRTGIVFCKLVEGSWDGRRLSSLCGGRLG